MIGDSMVVLIIAFCLIFVFNCIAELSEDTNVKDTFYTLAINLTAILAFCACYKLIK